MVDEIGRSRVDIELENPARPGTRFAVRNVLEDRGAEVSCVPASRLDALGMEPRQPLRFRHANGSVFRCAARLRGGASTTDVVFGEPDDLLLLGARSLEGLNLHNDPRVQASDGRRTDAARGFVARSLAAHLGDQSPQCTRVVARRAAAIT